MSIKSINQSKTIKLHWWWEIDGTIHWVVIGYQSWEKSTETIWSGPEGVELGNIEFSTEEMIQTGSALTSFLCNTATITITMVQVIRYLKSMYWLIFASLRYLFCVSSLRVSVARFVLDSLWRLSFWISCFELFLCNVLSVYVVVLCRLLCEGCFVLSSWPLCG